MDVPMNEPPVSAISETKPVLDEEEDEYEVSFRMPVKTTSPAWSSTQGSDNDTSSGAH